ncbi:hypothetical protein ABPG77_003645 [Micractinium sp. CCAP 211/92]
MEASHARLSTLIDRACARNQPDLDASALQGIKRLCRQSDDLVLAAWEALLSQMRATHAQTRLLAMRLCAQLFQRSRVFRLALLAQLSQFLELVLGFRPERPLPQPAQAAASLREEALELLESWSASHGARHKQLPMAVRYLRDTLQYRFPEVGARTAAAATEAWEREERQRAQLRARLAALLGGEWRHGAAAARQLLRELQECFALLEEERQLGREDRLPQNGQPAVGGGAGDAAAVEDLEWEDVAGADRSAASQQDAQQQEVGRPHEGLAAYAGLADSGAAANGNGAAAGEGGGDGGEVAAAHAVVLETLAGLYRQLTSRALPQVQEWLSVLGRVEPEGPQDEQQRQHLLRAATELRAQLAAAKERCDSQALDLEALLLQRQRREQQQTARADDAGPPAQQQQQQQQQQDGAAVAAALQDVFGGSDSDGEAEGQGSASAGSQRQRQQQQQRSQRQRQGRQQRRQEEVEDWESPYTRIVDPTLPRQQQEQRTLQPPQQAQQAQHPQQVQRQRSSSLPEEVRKKLAAQAPQLPSGTHTLFWDSKAVPTFVSGHGLEVSNHWGPVDVHKELPQERIDELFMLQMPSRQQQTAARRQQQQQQEAERRNNSQQRQPAQPAGGAGLDPQLQWPSRNPGAAGTGVAGPSAARPGSGAAQHPDSRAAKRARRAEERAYNEAIIGGAHSDAQLAQQLQDQDQAQATGAAGGEGGRGRRGRPAKRLSVKARLAQKLLRGGAAAAALREATAEEGEMVREREANRW